MSVISKRLIKKNSRLDASDDAALMQYLAEYGYSQGDISERLYQLILHDSNYHNIRMLLQEAPHTIMELRRKLNWTESQIESFVAAASKAEKNGDRLFDARYHMFLRAAESVFITLPPNKKLFLTPKNTHFEPDGTRYAVFEAAVCNHCHAAWKRREKKYSTRPRKETLADMPRSTCARIIPSNFGFFEVPSK